jgi:hypothetical protein
MLKSKDNYIFPLKFFITEKIFKLYGSNMHAATAVTENF